MKTEKQVRCWTIQKEKLLVAENYYETYQSANGEYVGNEKVKVIAHEDHLTIVVELESRIAKLRGALKVAQKDERERIMDEAGYPGFEGPLSVQTKFDEALADH